MHRNNELGKHKTTSLLSIGKLPNTTQNLIWELRLFKDELGWPAR
jgi:hypothetical protein